MPSVYSTRQWRKTLAYTCHLNPSFPCVPSNYYCHFSQLLGISCSHVSADRLNSHPLTACEQSHPKITCRQNGACFSHIPSRRFSSFVSLCPFDLPVSKAQRTHNLIVKPGKEPHNPLDRSFSESSTWQTMILSRSRYQALMSYGGRESCDLCGKSVSCVIVREGVFDVILYCSVYLCTCLFPQAPLFHLLNWIFASMVVTVKSQLRSETATIVLSLSA